MILEKFYSISHWIPNSMDAQNIGFLNSDPKKYPKEAKSTKKPHSSETLFVNYSEIMLPKPQAMEK